MSPSVRRIDDPIRKLSPVERDELHGTVYLLVNLEEGEVESHRPWGIYSSPVTAMTASGVGGELWHNVQEHYWEESDRWLIVPYLIDKPKPWAQADRDKTREQRRRQAYASASDMKRSIEEGEKRARENPNQLSWREQMGYADPARKVGWFDKIAHELNVPNVGPGGDLGKG